MEVDEWCDGGWYDVIEVVEEWRLKYGGWMKNESGMKVEWKWNERKVEWKIWCSWCDVEIWIGW
jgi:hypothetical protein